MLKSKGYATGGAVSAVVLRGDTGIRRGFDFWEDSIDVDPSFLSIGRAQRSGDVTREIAQKWIGEHGHGSQPFFFFFHIYEPHTPYEPVEPFRTRYRSAYDGEVATADDIVGKFLNYLRQEGIYDRATILLMSDHGEGLGDHGEDEHGILLYRETLQVPLILKLPHQAQKGLSVPSPVALIDVFPTIADAFGVPRTGPARSLLDVASGKVENDRSIYSETYYPRLHFGWSDLHSLINGKNHYIQSTDPELYDLTVDPSETKNILPENRRAYFALREQIKPYIRSPAAPSEVDDEQKRQLIALGYVGSTVSTSRDAVLPDPRKNIRKANLISQAFRLFKDARYEEALGATRELLHDNPLMLDIWALQSRVLAKLNRPEEAVDAAKEALRISPGSASLALGVATLSMDLGRLEDAEAHARLALKQSPHEAHAVMARIRLRQKKFAQARDEINAASGNGKPRPDEWMLLGQIALEEGKLDDALRSFDQVVALLRATHRRPPPQLSYFRGDTLARMGRADEAEREFLNEIRMFPADPQAYKNLILLYATEGKMQEATGLVFSLEKASPTQPSYVAISETLKTLGDRNGARFWAARGLSKFPSDRHLQALLRG